MCFVCAAVRVGLRLGRFGICAAVGGVVFSVRRRLGFSFVLVSETC